jgi:3-hydroxyacyl-CoA dehydrogenase/enoyl-CoA hydratase/3-hydroxybutyryl-CoA epimerase
VDDICESEQLARVSQETALSLVEKGSEGKLIRVRKKALPWHLQIAQTFFIRKLVFQSARRGVLRKTQDRMPAPLKLIQLLSIQYGGPREKHLEAEARALGETLSTAQAENLIRLFLSTEDAKRTVAPMPETKAVGVVGSGLMGSGIAVSLIDKAGAFVSLKDPDLKMLGRALKKAWDYEEKRVKRKEIDRPEAARRFHLLSASTGLGGFKNLDFVIEAAPEILGLKQKIFAELETVVSPTAVLASNTSSLRVSEISENAAHPERFIGMHFFSPAEVMPLVEIIQGPQTLPEVVSRTVSLVLRMGKIPVVVKDTPGFLVNRILLSYALEAALMVEEGVPVSDVDGAALKFGMPVGPICLIAEVGVEVMRTVMRRIQEAYGSRYPSPTWLNRDDLPLAFHRKPGGKWGVDGGLIARWVGASDPGLSTKDIQDRFFQAMVNESVRCLDEGIVETPALLDLAMVYGTGFPPEKGGPLREADNRGLTNIVQRGRALAERFGERLQPPAPLVQRVGSRENFTRGG